MDELVTKAVGFTPGMFWIFCGVAIAMGVIALLVMNLISKFRELRNPKVSDEKTVQDKLKSDHERLCKLEKTAEKQEEEFKLVLRSQLAIIHHMEDGNGLDKLKKIRNDIEEFLIDG